MLEELQKDIDIVKKNFWPTLFIVLNVVTSISIVIVNKWVFYTYHFHFATTLTFVHFITCFIGLGLCALCGLFQIKKLNWMDVAPLSISFCGFVVLTNLSLQYNTVGFYQIMKVLTTPFIILVEKLYYKKVHDRRIELSLIPVCVGVGLTSATDVQVNFVGTAYALAGVVITSFYQIWVGTKQKELGVNSMQLLFYQTPLSSFFLIFIIPFFDNVNIESANSLWYYEFQFNAVALIMLSAVIAFGVNLSIFLVIGKTSPVTYNVVGHFKLCVILVSGFVVFKDPVTSLNLLGVLLTLSGIFVYTHLKLQEQQKAQAPPVVALQKVDTPGPDTAPLLPGDRDKD